MTPHFRGDDGPASGGSLQSPGPRSLPLRSPARLTTANAGHGTLEALMRARSVSPSWSRPGDEVRNGQQMSFVPTRPEPEPLTAAAGGRQTGNR